MSVSFVLISPLFVKFDFEKSGRAILSNFKSEAMFAKLVELNVVPRNDKNIELEGAWLAIKAADSDSTW